MAARHNDDNQASRQRATSADPTSGDDGDDRLIEAEGYRSGRVLVGIYGDYLREFGWFAFIIFIVCMLVGNPAVSALGALYLARWSSPPTNTTITAAIGTQATHANARENLLIYAAYKLSADIFVFVAMLALSVGICRASRRFHVSILHSVLRAPLAWFERVPLGRILNRFSSVSERRLARARSSRNALAGYRQRR